MSTLRRLLAVAIPLGACILLSACAVPGGVTVSGTLSSSMNLSLATGSVTVTSGGTSYVANVSIPAPEPQAVTYSLSDVPPGTYDVSITLFSGIDWDVGLYQSSFMVNGISQFGSASAGPGLSERTFSLTDVSITDSATVDFLIEPFIGE